jgi:CRISPR/Cas system endoribonuclease Cas6 (RAMP superfamily)
MIDLQYQRFKNFENNLIESDDDIWYEVYKKVCEQNPNWPGNPFPVGLYREVVHTNPAYFKMGGREVQCPTIEALISKIVRAYGTARDERYAEEKGKKKINDRTESGE